MATLQGVTELYGLGDVHGDPDVMVAVLHAGGLLDSSAPHQWTGGSSALVVTGDTIDKGAHALAVMDILMPLVAQAQAAGGHVVVALGNHEAEFMADPASAKTVVFQQELMGAGLDPAAVALGASVYGQWLNTRPVAALVDGWFFSHAGNGGGNSVASMESTYRTLFNARQLSDSWIIGTDSLLEARQWWTTGASSTALIDADLAALPAQHIVFGHQPGSIPFPDDPQGTRASGTMAARYDGRLFMIDVGMSYAVANSSGALLHIHVPPPTTAEAIFPDGTRAPLWP